jgi:hypothetical protein
MFGDQAVIVMFPPDSTAGVTWNAGRPSVSANGEEVEAPGFGFATATVNPVGRGLLTVITAVR